MKLTIALTGLAIAGASPALAQTDLVVYHAWPHHAEWQTQIAADFMKQHPDVNITFQAPAPDYDEGLISVIRQNMAGDPPDVFMVGSHLLGNLVARDMVQPLDDVIGDTDMNGAGYSDEVLAFTQIDGVQYGLPWTSSTPVMFYNADLVTQAGGDPDNMPTTWEDTIALGKAINELGPDIMGMYYTPGDDDWMTQNLLASAGLAPITDDGTIAFDTDTGREAIRLFERFHDEAGQTAISNNDARQQMYAGKLGLYFNSTAAVRSFNTEIGEKFAWGTAQMPKLVDDGGVAAGGMAAVILTDDPDKRAAAWQYLLYGTGPEAQALIVENTGYMPVNSGALDVLDAFYADHPQFATSAEQTERAYPWFGWPGQNGARISQVVLDDMAAIANDQMSADEASADMTAKIKDLLPD